MSGELPFIDVDGIEVANGYRTLEYLRRLGGVKWQVPEVYPCSVLAREIGGIGPFVSPTADPAPWYDSTVPESAEFLGLISKVDFQSINVKRAISQRFGSLGGGVIGVEQLAARNLHVDGLLVAISCAGLEYGRHWVQGKLGSDCVGCSMRTIRVRESCPPSDGLNDVRGERIMYEAALVDGIQRTDNGGALCCDYDGIAFDMASQSPYLYSRPGAGTTPVNIQSSGGFMPPLPALLDSATRANAGPPPSASWTSTPTTGYGANLKIISNMFALTVGALNGGAYWNPGTFGPDCAVMATLAQRGSSGGVRLFARLTTPGTNGQGVFMNLQFGSAGADFVTIGRVLSSGSTIILFSVPANHTAAVGDRYALVCRGNLIEAWRQPTGGGAWVRLAAYYDPTTPVAGYTGIGMTESGSSPGLTNFSAGVLPTNGGIFPKDVITVPMPAVPVGIVSPIVTITAPSVALAGQPTVNSINGVRIQLKTGNVDCFQSDDFAVDDLAARWNQSHAADWAITGGKLKPTVTGANGSSGRRIHRKADSTARAISYLGGKVQATIKTTGSVTNGVWGVGFGGVSPGFGSGYGAFLVQATPGAGMGPNVFILSNDANGVTAGDSVAFTPAINTTYLIICEQLPLAGGGYDLRGYLIDPVTMTMLTRPLRATIGLVNAIVPPFTPFISSIPVSTSEEWDSFYSIDYTDSADYIDVGSPGGTTTVDASRRTSRFLSSVSNSVSVDGSPQLGSPIDVPLGWVDLCAGQGPGCLQVWGDDTALYLSTVSVALQQRQR